MGSEAEEYNYEGSEGDYFKVKITKKDVVAAVLPLQEHWLPLSNLDLLLPPLDVSVFFCYGKPTAGDHNSMSFGTMVGILKKSLLQALASYYVFAGEVVQNSNAEPEVLCNNRGVDFIEAFADIRLRDLNLYNPDDTVDGKLVPVKKRGVFAVQATELKCGGIIVGCTFDHRIADAYSANMFLVSWAEMAQSKPISVTPCFRRSMLNPRRPGFIHPSLDNMYVPINTLPPPKQPPPGANHLISRIYHVSAEELARLQSFATVNNKTCKRTKLEAFSAFLWKLVAQCHFNKQVVCKMGVVVDGRTRLNDGEPDPTLLNSYFGNVLSIPFGEIKVIDLIEKPLDFIAQEVHEFLKTAVTKEHFLGLIDWVEAHRPVPGVAKIYCSGGEDGGPAFVVSSGQSFPVREVDFGWGKAVLGSYHFPWGGEAGYVMPMRSPAGNGDWIVYMHLLKKQIEVIESQASQVFRPLTVDCLRYL